jgi:hypothetical protein
VTVGTGLTRRPVAFWQLPLRGSSKAVEDSKAALQRLGHSQQALRNGKGAGAMATGVQH